MHVKSFLIATLSLVALATTGMADGDLRQARPIPVPEKDVVLPALPPSPSSPSGESQVPESGSSVKTPSATSPETPTPAPPVDIDRANELALQLGADQYAVREAAEAQLITMGQGVLKPLDRTLATTKDSEVLMRLERVYRALTPQETYAGRNPQPGFLGVQMEVHSTDEDPRLKGREWGVKVVSVVPDSPAEKAKLQANDLIVKVDGEPFLGDVTAGSFVRRVQQAGAGADVEIELFRGTERLTVTATLSGTAKPAEGQDPNVPGQPANVRQVVIINGRVVSQVPSSSAVTEQDIISYRWRRWWRAHCDTVRGVKKSEAGEAKDAPDPVAPMAKVPAVEKPSSDRPKEKP